MDFIATVGTVIGCVISGKRVPPINLHTVIPPDLFYTQPPLRRSLYQCVQDTTKRKMRLAKQQRTFVQLLASLQP
ncbi:MAG TPA: hypothetical protein PK539_03995 [Candidatus Paceibacterota bacterium]|nr:hypothetical protein [Candidatus Paceibacterota bacterium]